MSAGGDRGEPASLEGGSAGRVFAALVDAVLDIAPVVEMGDCTARMLDAIEAAVHPSPASPNEASYRPGPTPAREVPGVPWSDGDVEWR